MTSLQVPELYRAETGCFPNGDRYIDIVYGEDCFIDGLLTSIQNCKVAIINRLYVDEQLHRNGIGSRLLSSFITTAMVYGAETLWSDRINNEALSLRARLFGQTAMTFYDPQHPESGFLPLTYTQSVASNVRISAVHPQDDNEHYLKGIGVCVNLADIQTAHLPAVDELIDKGKVAIVH